MENVATSVSLRTYYPYHGNRVFGIGTFSESDLKKLERKFIPQKLLDEADEDDILIAVPGSRSILSFEGQMPRLFNAKHMYYWRHNNGGFTKRSGEAAWRLIKKIPLANSQEKSWDEQKSMLSKNQYVPDTRTLIYAAIMLYKEKGEKMFSSGFVRTADTNGDPMSRVVMKFDKDYGIMFHYWPDAQTINIAGCAIGTKF